VGVLKIDVRDWRSVYLSNRSLLKRDCGTFDNDLTRLSDSKARRPKSGTMICLAQLFPNLLDLLAKKIGAT
jgi:hypothetical protein